MPCTSASVDKIIEDTAFQDPLDRQIMEKIQIQTLKLPVLMNRRSEMGGVRVERMQYRRWGGGN